MSRNKNTPGTGDRGALPESLVGRIFKQERELEAVKKELADLKGQKPAASEAPPPPPPPPTPEPEPKPKPEPKPAPVKPSAPPPPPKKGGGSIFKNR